MDFTVTRTGDLTSQITVGYTTVAGTAQPNTDFTPTTGTTTFASGSATATIAIPIFGNGVYNNPSLTFSVQLTGIINVVGPPVTLAAQQTLRHRAAMPYLRGGRRTSTATASPTSIVANDSVEHGVGAAEHDGAGRDHALLRRPADLRHRQRARSPWRRRTSTATASPTSSSPTEARQHGVGAAEHDARRARPRPPSPPSRPSPRAATRTP